jgi:glycosyltransferase involved in cell wall biosynthesis
MEKAKVAVIIPALNEEAAIGYVLQDLPGDLAQQVVVADNGSTDRTAIIAAEHGAEVVFVPIPGYGRACLQALNRVRKEINIIVFLDGDYSDYPQDLAIILNPILLDRADMVIGSRVGGKAERGSLTPQQILGNWLATKLISIFWGFRYTDLGPFRAIKADKLRQLEMSDANFGWTVEMQIKAIKHKLRIEEVAVRYRKRLGYSKVSGTVMGSIKAGTKILYLIAKYGFAGS